MEIHEIHAMTDCKHVAYLRAWPHPEVPARNRCGPRPPRKLPTGYGGWPTLSGESGSEAASARYVPECLPHSSTVLCCLPSSDSDCRPHMFCSLTSHAPRSALSKVDGTCNCDWRGARRVAVWVMFHGWPSLFLICNGFVQGIACLIFLPTPLVSVNPPCFYLHISWMEETEWKQTSIKTISWY